MKTMMAIMCGLFCGQMALNIVLMQKIRLLEFRAKCQKEIVDLLQTWLDKHSAILRAMAGLGGK